jgi:putative endonuclease
VKEKTGTGFGDPLEMVTAEKQRRVRRAAAAWVTRHEELAQLRIGFDVVAVRGRSIERVEDAFDL